MAAPIDLGAVLDRAWEEKTLEVILAAPVSALEGVTVRDGEMLFEMFGVRTVADLAACAPFRYAAALAELGRSLKTER